MPLFWLLTPRRRDIAADAVALLLLCSQLLLALQVLRDVLAPSTALALGRFIEVDHFLGRNLGDLSRSLLDDFLSRNLEVRNLIDLLVDIARRRRHGGITLLDRVGSLAFKADRNAADDRHAIRIKKKRNPLLQNSIGAMIIVLSQSTVVAKVVQARSEATPKRRNLSSLQHLLARVGLAQYSLGGLSQHACSMRRCAYDAHRKANACRHKALARLCCTPHECPKP